MSFLDEEVVVDKYLKIITPDQGKTTKLKVRVLTQPAAKVFRHWIGLTFKNSRPFNCPSRTAGCVACAERQYLKDKNIGDYRDTHRMEKKFLVNVLVLGENPEVKILNFGQGLGNKLEFLFDEHGDLRDYDITLLKRKTGPDPKNIEYDALYADDPDPKKRRKLSDAEKLVAEGAYDLAEEIKPASLEAIEKAVRGTKGEQVDESALATVEQKAELKKAMDKRGFTYTDLSIPNEDAVTAIEAANLIAKLS